MGIILLKIAIVGHSGSGKSTLAKILGAHYDIPVLHLDSVHFKANWIERNLDESLGIVKKFMQNENWVIDGSYTKLFQKERFEQADRIIFLDFNRLNCLIRAYKRFSKDKGTSRPDMANGCLEKFDLEFVLWILRDGRTSKRLRRFVKMKNDYSSKTIVLRNQKEIDFYLKNNILPNKTQG